MIDPLRCGPDVTEFSQAADQEQHSRRSREPFPDANATTLRGHRATLGEVEISGYLERLEKSDHLRDPRSTLPTASQVMRRATARVYEVDVAAVTDRPASKAFASRNVGLRQLTAPGLL